MEKNLVDLIKDAGIVGAGGAGFPTHVKTDTKAQYIIINGAECEPLLRVDQQLMAIKSRQILDGLKLVMEYAEAEHGYVALKAKYKNAVESLEKIIGEYNDISLHTLDSFYPAGDEQVIVYEVTKRIVPEGGIPLNVDVVVLNVETVLNIYEKYYNDSNVTDKYVTVTGEVKNPVTVKVPIGITVKETIDLAGGALLDNFVVINGGPMMGKMTDIKNPIDKTTKSLIVLSENHSLVTDKTKDISKMLKEARTSCMHCSLCTEVCPRNLLGHRLEPHKLIRLESYVGIGSNMEFTKNAFLCCECRLCEYACVMNLKPWQINGFLKNKLSKNGIKNTLKNTPEKVHPFREYKKFPVNRLIAKLGITKYNVDAPMTDVGKSFTEVSIPLKQHIGVPAVPVVSVGDTVSKGDLIADIADGKLGSKVHASISGTIIEINNDIIKIDRSV